MDVEVDVVAEENFIRVVGSRGNDDGAAAVGRGIGDVIVDDGGVVGGDGAGGADDEDVGGSDGGIGNVGVVDGGADGWERGDGVGLREGGATVPAARIAGRRNFRFRLRLAMSFRSCLDWINIFPLS